MQEQNQLLESLPESIEFRVGEEAALIESTGGLLVLARKSSGRVCALPMEKGAPVGCEVTHTVPGPTGDPLRVTYRVTGAANDLGLAKGRITGVERLTDWVEEKQHLLPPLELGTALHKQLEVMFRRQALADQLRSLPDVSSLADQLTLPDVPDLPDRRASLREVGVSPSPASPPLRKVQCKTYRKVQRKAQGRARRKNR